MVRPAPTTSLGLVALSGCLFAGVAGALFPCAAASAEAASAIQTLRVDYFHGGDATSEYFQLDSFVLEGEWPGSPTHTVGFPDFGVYRFEVRDNASQRLLFAQGFCTLFGEWRTTDEAKERKAQYHESIRFPKPDVPSTLYIMVRNKQGAWTPAWTLPIQLDGQLRAPPEGLRATVEQLSGGTQPPAKTLDLVIVADGYSAAQRDKALADARRFSNVLLSTPPFDRYADRIAIRLVLPEASQTGPDEPRKQRHTASPAGLNFNTFDSERYLTTSANRQLRDLAGLVPYEFILVLANTARYGGGGIYNFFSIGISDNDFDEYVWMHEFGHAFAGLGDEYYSSGVAMTDLYPAGVEPWEPNITALLAGRERFKWASLVASGTPVPTPDESAFDSVVGAFEGAGYAAKGLYRPARDCKMFSKKDRDFCPVCMRTIEDTIRLYVE